MSGVRKIAASERFKEFSGRVRRWEKKCVLLRTRRSGCASIDATCPSPRYCSLLMRRWVKTEAATAPAQFKWVAVGARGSVPASVRGEALIPEPRVQVRTRAPRRSGWRSAGNTRRSRWPPLRTSNRSCRLPALGGAGRKLLPSWQSQKLRAARCARARSAHTWTARTTTSKTSGA
jgi:hypothetical protein